MLTILSPLFHVAVLAIALLLVGCTGEPAPNASTSEIQDYLAENPDAVVTAEDEAPSEEEQYEMSEALAPTR